MSSWLTESVDWKRGSMKNLRSLRVRKRTSGRDRPEVPDRRVQRTKASLRNALIGLAREKPYPTIAVKEILERANVGRSTFYTHFSDKDELLDSGIREILAGVDLRGSRDAGARALAFALPILTYVDEHRRHADGSKMARQSRLAMHAHLEHLLSDRIAEDIADSWTKSSTDIPPQLLARHIAGTFVLLLNWWIDTESPLTPAEVDARFRALVLPALPTAR
jgi:AcrR family transcriptional regulator